MVSIKAPRFFFHYDIMGIMEQIKGKSANATAARRQTVPKIVSCMSGSHITLTTIFSQGREEESFDLWKKDPSTGSDYENDLSFFFIRAR